MKYSLMKRIMSVVLLMAMLLQTTPTAYAGVTKDTENNIITLTDTYGNEESYTEEEWAELFPYGTFAFRETELSLIEGAEGEGKTATLTLYRIGGTEGRADATVTLTPAVVQIEEDRLSYANAMGTNDYTLQVEDPWPIAYYQPYGNMTDVVYTGKGLVWESLEEEVPEEVPEGEDLTLVKLIAPEGADSYQWEMEVKMFGTYVKRWNAIENATSREFSISEAGIDYILSNSNYTCDFRCKYVINGNTYCSDTLGGVVYETGEDLPPEKPEGFVDDRTRTDSDIYFDGEEYDSYSFDVVFADGEWEKEITFTVQDDNLHETVELLSVVLTDARGATVNKGACTVSVSVKDDEEILPSQMGFAETEIWVDKAAGKARIPLTRVSEGLQYVTGVGYELVDGSAVAGKDYAGSDDSTLFASDLDYTYLEVDLVNDGIALSKEESDLYFTIRLTEPMGGTFIDGKTEMTVRLYNSAEDNGQSNLATDLYSAEETDMTGKVTETPALIAPNKTVYGSAVDVGQNAVAEYSLLGDDGISAFTYNYGKLQFTGAHGGNFWTDNAQLAREDYTVSSYGFPRTENTDDHEKYVANRAANWEGESGSYGTGVYKKVEKNGSMSLTVPNLLDRYTRVGVLTRGRADTSAGVWYGGDDWSVLTFEIGDQWDWLTDDHNNQWYDKYFIYTLDEASGNTLLFRHKYYGNWPEGDAQSESRLLNGFMTRRQITMPQLRIHTADDDFIQSDDTIKSLHESIKPIVALVAGRGGTSADGTMLYNNSTMTVTRGNNASSYDFAAQANGSLTNNSLFLSGQDENRRFDRSTASVTSTGGTITLLVDAASAQNKEDTYINVVMDRTQKYALEISPSVPKLTEGDTTIDPNKIGDTWEYFWQKVYANNPDGITYTYKEVNWNFENDGDGFSDEKNTMLEKGALAQEGVTTKFITPELKNVLSVNFHLDAEDIIVLAGVAYAGNEDIPIPANVLLDDTVTFYYYDKDYVTGINTMLASISRVERYIDLNDDHMVKGTVDNATGEFIPDVSEKLYDPETMASLTEELIQNEGYTYVNLASLTEESYPITHLGPRALDPYDLDGEKYEVILKAFYTMLPRSLVVPEGESEADTAEVVPAIVTSVTEPAARAKLTDEQLAYRYINHGGTGNDKMMYTAAASKPSFVDIPMGGDFGTRYAGADPNDETSNLAVTIWEPEWRGNPYEENDTPLSFADPDPIYLDGTLLGDHYPVGEVYGSTSEDRGKLTETGVKAVNNYLYSMQANDTFTLCVREADTDDGSTTYSLTADSSLKGIESSSLSGTETSAGSASFGGLEDPTAGDANAKKSGMDSSAAGSSFPEFDMMGDINLPAMDLSISDFVSVGIDGQEMSLSVGFGLVSGGWENNFKDQTNHNLKPWEGNGFSDTNREAVGKVKRFINTIKSDNTLAGTKKTLRESYQDYNKEVYDARRSRPLDPNNPGERKGTVASKGVGFSLGFELGIVLKWDPIESRFFFNQAYVALTGGFEFSYTVRFTPVPFLFLCVKFSIEIQLALALEASRVKVIDTRTNLDADYLQYTTTTGEWTYYENQLHMGHDPLDEPEEKDFLVGTPGSTFMYTTTAKAIDVHFTGAMYVEIIDEGNNGNRLDDFEPGVIRSAGDEAATVKAVRQVDGEQLEPYTYKFTVVDDGGTRQYNKDKNTYTDLPEGSGVAIVDQIVSIKRQTHDVYFGGFSVSPEMFLEVSVGFDALLFKFEIFLNISVGCSFAFGVHDSADYEGEKAKDYEFQFNEFSAAFTLGFRVSALLIIDYEFTGLQFMVTYDRQTKYDEDTNKKNGWNYIWYGANRPFKEYSLLEDDTNPLEPTVVLPSMKEQAENLYTPEDNLTSGNTFAITPSDEKVPFQYSGYGTSGDAFALSSDILSGSTYELITAQGRNYLVYTINRDSNTMNAGNDINAPQLVISLVQETAVSANEEDGTVTKTAMGLVNPIDPTSETPYVVLDTLDDGNGNIVEDKFGDTDFDVWVDSDEDIHVAWVTYTEGVDTAFLQNIADDEGNVTTTTTSKTMQAMGPYTEVRTVKLDVDTYNEDYTAIEKTAITKGSVETVSDTSKMEHGMYYMPTGAEDMVFYAEAVYYGDDELETILDEYKTNYYTSPYVGEEDTDISKTDEGINYGTDDPTVLYQLAMKRTRMEAYGKSFYPNFAARNADGTYAVTRVQSKDWLDNGVVLDNFSLTRVEGSYYAAYSTSDTDLEKTDAETETWDEKTIKKLYLQKLTVEEKTTTEPNPDGTGSDISVTTKTVTPSKATALRKLVSYANSEEKDGLYTDLNLTTKYNDPYFSNINFLTGKLGGLDTSEEAEEYNYQFNDQIEMQSFMLDDTAQTFLLFEMNGNVYIVPEDSLASITDETTSSGKIIPFFQKDSVQDDSSLETIDGVTYSDEIYPEADPIITNVTVGVDGNQNIVAVYTRSVNGAPGNALYMTKYDPNYSTYDDENGQKTSPWGVGTRLAMVNMQTIEDAEAERLSANDTALRYYDTNGDGKLDTNDTPKSFTFNKIRIGLAGQDKLLVISEGSLSQLTAKARMQPVLHTDSSTGVTDVTGLKPVLDDNNEPVYDFNIDHNGTSYDITKGVYALSFGMGKQSLGNAALHLSNYDLTPGSEMDAYVTFINSGDVAIRASEANPATVTLMAYTETGFHTLAAWNLTENVRAGQKVVTDRQRIDGKNMPADLTNGSKIYFTVSEDATYFVENAFTATTKTDAGEADTLGCITVADKVEMGFENIEIEMVGVETVDGKEMVVLAPNIHVGNRGSADSDTTYLHFEYETVQYDATRGYDVTVREGVDLTGHNLTVSDEEALKPYNLASYTEEHGYLLLRTMQDGVLMDDATKEGQIQSMHGRTVTGTFRVPKDYYDANFGTGSLNLRVSIVSLTGSDLNEEYNIENNEQLISVEPKTFFTTIDSVQMQKGSMLRLPLSMITSTKTKPNITVTELAEDNVRNLSVLYYDANQGSVVVMPAREGEGKIRIADTATNSYHDICYRIQGEGVALNIYEDNGIFTWYDAEGNGGDTGHDAWDFERALYWTPGDQNTIPLNGDLSYASAGESFSFKTFANQIDLYFMGDTVGEKVEIEVSSDLGAFGKKTYVSDGYETPVTIDFQGDSQIAHTVTITAKSDLVRFDRMEEKFGENLSFSSDPTAPGIYWSRTLPETGSIYKVNADVKVPLTAYFTDLGGLVSVTLDGEDITDQLTTDGEELWYYDMGITENGSHRFVVTDTAGNTTTRDLSVDWFSATVIDPTKVTPDPGAPAIEVKLVTKDGPAPDIIPADVKVYLAVTDENGIVPKAEVSEYVYDKKDAPTSQYFNGINADDTAYGYLMNNGGVYRVAVTENGVTSYRFVNMDNIDTNKPTISTPAIGTNEKDEMTLTFTVEKVQDVSGESSPICSVMLNGKEELLAPGETTFKKEITVVVKYGGAYQITATDKAGNVGQSNITTPVEPKPITLGGGAVDVDKVEEEEIIDSFGDAIYTSKSDGKITIDPGMISGGSVKDENTTEPEYQYALVPVDENGNPVEPTEEDWLDANDQVDDPNKDFYIDNDGNIVFDNLDKGNYALFIRDANDTDNVTEAIIIPVEFVRLVVHEIQVTVPTKEVVNDGSITVVATGGAGELAYSFVPQDLIDSGAVTIDDNSTPDDDSDDLLIYKDKDGKELYTRPLWQSGNTMANLPIGTYMVSVRDTEDHTRSETETITLAYDRDYREYLGFFDDMWEITNQEFEITATAGEGGSITDEGVRKVKYSLTAKYVITPDKGYRVASVIIDGEDKGVLLTHSFRSVKEDHTIEVIFEKVEEE